MSRARCAGICNHFASSHDFRTQAGLTDLGGFELSLSMGVAEWSEGKTINELLADVTEKCMRRKLNTPLNKGKTNLAKAAPDSWALNNAVYLVVAVTTALIYVDNSRVLEYSRTAGQFPLVFCLFFRSSFQQGFWNRPHTLYFATQRTKNNGAANNWVSRTPCWLRGPGLLGAV